MSSQSGSKIETYCQAWAEGLALLLSRMTAVSWQTEPAAASTGTAPLTCMRITAAGGLAGRQWLTLGAPDVGQLLQTFMGDDVTIVAPLDEMQKEAIEELVRQWSGLVASSLKPDYGEVSWDVAVEGEWDASAASATTLQVGDGSRSVAAVLQLESSLAERLNAAAENPQPAPATVVANSSARIEELLRQGNLELLMDVELAVMLRFGSRQTTLHEVLDLSAGAVLELDREVQEPVDLVLNGKVIARGEVVVVDGNYGLRVLEVASPQQRVSTL